MKPELKKEALRRMRALRLMSDGFDSPVGDFNLKETAWKSEYYGILYYLDKQEKKIVAVIVPNENLEISYICSTFLKNLKNLHKILIIT